MLFPFCHLCPGAEPGTSLCLFPQGAAENSEVTSWPSLVQTGQPECAQPLFTECALLLDTQSPSASFVSSSGSFQYFNVLFVFWKPNLHIVLKMRTTTASNIQTAFDWMTVLYLMHPKMHFAFLNSRAHCCHPYLQLFSHLSVVQPIISQTVSVFCRM